MGYCVSLTISLYGDTLVRKGRAIMLQSRLRVRLIVLRQDPLIVAATLDQATSLPAKPQEERTR